MITHDHLYPNVFWSTDEAGGGPPPGESQETAEPEVTSEQTEVAESEVTETATEPEESTDYQKWISSFKDRGYDDPSKALEDLDRLNQEYSRAAQLAQYGEYYLQNYDKLQPQAEQPKREEGPPVLTEEDREQINEFYAVDPRSGRWVAKPECPPELKQKVNRFRQWAEGNRKKFERDPDSFIRERGYVKKDEIISEVEERIRAEIEKRDAYHRARQIMEAHRSELFQADGVTKTPYGKQIEHHVLELERRFPNLKNDPEVVFSMARDTVDAQRFRQSQLSKQKEDSARKKAGLPPAVSTPASRATPTPTEAAKQLGANATLGEMLTARDPDWHDKFTKEMPL